MAEKADTVKVKLSNPTVAPRVIYDGIPDRMQQIYIPAGGSVDDVEISKVIHDELLEREEDEPGQDLKIEKATGTTKRGRGVQPTIDADANAPPRADLDAEDPEQKKPLRRQLNTPAQSPAQRAQALIAEADDTPAAEYRKKAREIIGEEKWPGGSPSKDDVTELLQDVR